MRGKLAVVAMCAFGLLTLAVQANEKPTAAYQQAMKDNGASLQSVRATVKAIEGQGAYPDYEPLDNDLPKLTVQNPAKPSGNGNGDDHFMPYKRDERLVRQVGCASEDHVVALVAGEVPAVVEPVDDAVGELGGVRRIDVLVDHLVLDVAVGLVPGRRPAAFTAPRLPGSSSRCAAPGRAGAGGRRSG